MKISDLAKLTQCTTETIRYYEKEGLLPQPERTTGNYRDYQTKHVERLRFIRNCRALDMNHAEIRALLSLIDQGGNDCGQVNLLLDEHIGHVQSRILALQQLAVQLQALRQQCQHQHALEDCGIIQGLSDMETPPAASSRTHSH